MANEYRDRFDQERDCDRGRGRDVENRGMFGYEGEGYMRDDYDRDRWRRESYRGRGPKNYQRSEERIREDVCERLTMDHDVDASDLEVQVSGATVTLSGTVHDLMEKRRAEDIAESVLGVKDVQNQIRIRRD